MGIFDDAKTVMIGNKEVQSIITSNGGVLYEKPQSWSLSLTGDKSVMMTGETATLTATLTNNNVPVSGETIYFDGILNSTSTTRTITDTETIVSSKYDVLTVPSTPDFLYLDKDKHIELTSFNGSIILTIDRVTTGQDISNISVDNGILSYTEEGVTETVDISSYDLSVVSCTSGGTATIGDYGYYAVTNSNGVATVSYVGKGTGDLNIQAIYNGSLSSEIYVIEDCLYWNDGSSITGLEIDSNVNCTSNGEYITITTSTSGEKDVKIPVTLTGDWTFETTVAEIGVVNVITFKVGTGNQWGACAYPNVASVNLGSGTRDLNTPINIGGVFKVKYLNGTMYGYWNNQLVTSRSVTVNGKIGYYTNNGRVQHIKNIKLKAL